MNKSKLNKLIIALVILGVIQLVCSFTNKSILGLIYFDGPYYGHVVDAVTGEPVEGAVVAGMWDFEHIAVTMLINKYANATESITSKDGRFHLPRVWALTFWPFTLELSKPEILVFKSEYDSHPPGIQHSWSEIDEKSRGISQDEYRKEYWITCRPNKDCAIKLNKTQNTAELKAAYTGVHNIGKVPMKNRHKVKNFLTVLNTELNKFNADTYRIEN